MLHAWRLRITIPGESEPRTFEAPIPQDLSAALKELAKDRVSRAGNILEADAGRSRH
jgi:hypothetical protein